MSLPTEASIRRKSNRISKECSRELRLGFGARVKQGAAWVGMRSMLGGDSPWDGGHQGQMAVNKGTHTHVRVLAERPPPWGDLVSHITNAPLTWQSSMYLLYIRQRKTAK